jgi:hypothetical protein
MMPAGGGRIVVYLYEAVGQNEGHQALLEEHLLKFGIRLYMAQLIVTRQQMRD